VARLRQKKVLFLITLKKFCYELFESELSLPTTAWVKPIKENSKTLGKNLSVAMSF
jgi:hypothetical protein